MAEQKLILLGNQGVGKTALITQLVHNVFEETYTSTIGLDLFTKTMMLDKTFTGCFFLSYVFLLYQSSKMELMFPFSSVSQCIYVLLRFIKISLWQRMTSSNILALLDILNGFKKRIISRSRNMRSKHSATLKVLTITPCIFSNTSEPCTVL